MSGPVVTLYGRAGCHLCDEALALIERLRPKLGFEVEQVDIEANEELLERYVFAIPVLAVGEREVARAPIFAAALEEGLREALTEHQLRRQPGTPRR
jgi:glutaredoxin